MSLTTDSAFTPAELLVCVAARCLEENSSVLVGTGLPMIAAMLAQKTHAPHLLVMFEAGGVGPQVPSLPISVGDSRTYHRAVMASTMHDIMAAASAGYIDFGFLGGAAIDSYGNLNTTVIGDWSRPRVRLPGSGGANDVASFCWRTIVVMRNQSTRTFVEQLPFITTPGFLSGPGARERAGLPAGTGPYRVITQLGVYGFDESSKGMMLVAKHVGVTIDEIQKSSEFEILIPSIVAETQPPTPDERRLLWEIDPTGLVLERGPKIRSRFG